MNLLIVDPKKRMTADNLLKNPWILGEVQDRKDNKDVLAKMKEWNSKRKVN
jgi:hypothetical protein